MKEESEFRQAESVGSSIRPFYEWIPDRFPIPFIIKLLLSILLGFLFLVPRYWIVREDILNDWSWLLCLLITTAMICLYYATHTFRAMFPQMNLQLQTQDPTVIDNAYFSKVKYYLSDKMFIWTGLAFAVLNCVVGRGLGVGNEISLATATTYLGLFNAGFVCGMAVCGIIGVVITLTAYLDHEPKVDYTNPDGCGGFLYFGEALITFAGVTLVVGFLISLYILKALWVPGYVQSDLPLALMWLWIAFPFGLSLLILLAPASSANQALLNHKIEKEVELALRFDKARDVLRQAGTDAERREELRHEIEYYGELRGQLHRMRAWPFNTQANIKFVILFVSNAYVAIESIRGLLSSAGRFLPF